MVEKKIFLKSADEARELVNIATGCDFDVNLRHGRVQIDAKSIVGVLGVDLRHDLVISYDGESEALDAFTQNHLVIEK